MWVSRTHNILKPPSRKLAICGALWYEQMGRTLQVESLVEWAFEEGDGSKESLARSCMNGGAWVELSSMTAAESFPRPAYTRKVSSEMSHNTVHTSSPAWAIARP